jgi:heme oxygenase
MTFFNRLQQTTSEERMQLLDAPIIADAMRGHVSRRQYLDFLARAYHHVKHTPSLLMACGARLSENREWLRPEVIEYAQEEIGHHEWILNDISAAGGDAQAVRRSRPPCESELLVSYAYDTVMRGNPAGVFGMVYVLEGTSVSLATKAAESLQRSLGLPTQAFTYLRSHGALDVEHFAHFEQLMNRIDDPGDQLAIEHCAKVCFHLYTNLLAGVGRLEAA